MRQLASVSFINWEGDINDWSDLLPFLLMIIGGFTILWGLIKLVWEIKEFFVLRKNFYKNYLEIKKDSND